MLDIFKDSGEMVLELSFLEDSVLSRTGCSFITLHNKILSQEMDFESLGIEDFIENDSRIFWLYDSRVVVGLDVYPWQQVRPTLGP